MLTLALACGLSVNESSSQSTNAEQQTRPRTVSDSKKSESEESKEKSKQVLMQSSGAEKSEVRAVSFYDALKRMLKERKLKLKNICDKGNSVERRILEDYGAVYVASREVLPPPVCMFTSEEEVVKFQNEAGFTKAVINGVEIELQPAAMQALLKAREEALAEGLDITPRGGTEAARRGYDDTLRLWNTRFLPAIAYWSEQGKLKDEQVEKLPTLPIKAQVKEVLKLEKKEIFFSQDFSKSILYSIAAPGASQHISMLAFDATEFLDERVRGTLARHGWFQTVLSDLPHFTYLGLAEEELRARGLRREEMNGQVFWIPNVKD